MFSDFLKDTVVTLPYSKKCIDQTAGKQHFLNKSLNDPANPSILPYTDVGG